MTFKNGVPEASFPSGSVVKNHLEMQKSRVLSLILEDPTRCRATKPVGHNYSVCALEPGSCNCRAHVLQLLEKPTVPWSPGAATREATAVKTPGTTTKDPAQPKINQKGAPPQQYLQIPTHSKCPPEFRITVDTYHLL